MKKFIGRVFSLFLIVLSIYVIISLIVNPGINQKSDYMAAMSDKHMRIQQLNCPKIIFAGGSNLAFGIDSEKIEEEYSIPVVNLGLHAGLGLNFMLEELKHVVQKNDIVFISLEYFLDLEGDYAIKKNASNYFPEAVQYYDFSLMNEVSIHLSKTRNNGKLFFSTKKIDNTKSKDKNYSREAFNKYGDEVLHLLKSSPDELKDRQVIKYRYWEGIEKLNEFAHFARSNGVFVFYLLPNFPQSEYDKYEDILQNYYRDLKNDLKIEILNKPTDFLYPDSLFYDTVYHLNKIGRDLRTNKLIELIDSNPRIIGLMDSIR